ncbi:excinuclease ABC subunit C uvrC [Candidatus Kinetoplastibacterium blastocrithidii TCC012E]|uniref:UvrABC system protein C n=1 Tax=Candidatus Kinetoplastidibacterium blastocrithidiae TCC012E TaxID=1208922 RepID=M1MCW4_9PROT|nr:excinuclease ABC subunit UvrC [Candidatus Kinetoplastibacterium blastocrithidii]AFZ83899.1 excinuclease ABC subunit C [Candidatus Kinetoplastibacterium blastocrithidii (ex Strigomonas culicis)]AGF49620.1 excinuclease ABC subunit C uvrC [Candidatus Kinetoplastibacterium blastocrithidii TCC012E]
MLNNSNLKVFLANLPSLPGIYKYIDSFGNIIYVGKAKDLKKRISSYFINSSNAPRVSVMVSKISNIEFTVTNSEVDALILENNLIKSIHPRYNILFRDDKSYPYLKISSQEWPRLIFCRVYKEKIDGQYFGPFPDSGAVRETIKILQKIFRLRICDDAMFANRSRPCLLGQISRCSAPCVGLINKNDYLQDVSDAILFLNGKSNHVIKEIKEKMNKASQELNFELASVFRDQVAALSKILNKQTMESSCIEDTDIISVVSEGNKYCVNIAMVRYGRHLGDRSFFSENEYLANAESVLDAFSSQFYLKNQLPDVLVCSHNFTDRNTINSIKKSYGEAKKIKVFVSPVRGIRYSWLKQATYNAKLALQKKFDNINLYINRINKLTDILKIKLKNLSSFRVECFDISHFKGEATRASCVVFENCGMSPSLYRHFIIDKIIPGDDCAAIEQVLYKRFSQKNIKMPHIVLIDGGRGQIEVSKKVFENLNLDVRLLIGISKGDNRKAGLETLVFADDRNDLILGIESEALMLLAHIRDEAHRFAISSMRNVIHKSRFYSKIIDIKGIGEKRCAALLKYFGSMSGISSATMEEISSVEGIPNHLAKAIYESLH